MTTNQLIAVAASKIAGAAWDDAESTDLVARLNEVRNLSPAGSDGDLTQADRDAIDTLICLASGEKFTLCNYQTGESIRQATDAEVCDCAVAQSSDGGVGAFAIEGITCCVN